MIHVLVDVDETVLSAPPGLNAKASSVMFKKVFNIDAHEEMIDNVGKTEKGIIKEVLEKIGVQQVSAEREPLTSEIPDEAYRTWADATAEELRTQPARVLPGVIELLTELSNNPSVRLSLLSGSSSYRAEAKLKSVNLDNFFRDPSTGKLIGVFGEMADRREQLFDMIKQNAADEDSFVVIDDSLVGARMAKDRNIPSIMVATGKATEEELRAFTPYVFSDLGEDRWREAVSIISGQQMQH